MTEKGRNVLDSLLREHRDAVAWVVSGRDQSLEDDGYEDIQRMCAAEGVPFYERGEFPAETVPYAIAISWRWIISADETRLIVVHDSMLPKYRGFNPLVTALINGDEEIGATALWANADYDRGEIIMQRSVEISYPMKIGRAIKIMAQLYVELVLKVVGELTAGGEWASQAQDESKASYSLWRDADDYHLDWALGADVLKRQIDAQGPPYAGATSRVGARLLRIRSAEVEADVAIANRQSGKVIFLKDGQPTVVCGKGLLRITEAEFEDTGESLVPARKFRMRFT